ncbi:MAG: SDR family oxidoreductase [Bacteroidota bacterium]|jgi:3-oxoacyl-[acyl-carrier protein] reductase
MKVSNQTIFITGAAGNFGSYLCEYFVNNHAENVIATDIDEVKLIELQKRIPKLEVRVCDLTNRTSVNKLMNELAAKFKISVIINNAGWIHSEPLVNLLNKDNPSHNFDNWDKVIKLNLYTCFNVGAESAAMMMKQRIKGCIINVSSIAANGNIGQTAYAAAKAGIDAMTKTWCKELGIFKIRSVAVAPGFIDTASTHESLSDAVIEKWKKQIPISSLGSLDHIAQTIKFIIENDYINGKTIAVDGGLIL